MTQNRKDPGVTRQTDFLVRVGNDTTLRSDWVGGRVTPPVRPHHRAYGSVHGGSSAPLQIPELSQKVQESPHRKQAIGASAINCCYPALISF